MPNSAPLAVATPAPAGAAWRQRLPGLALSGALAAGAIALAQIPWLEAHGFSALTLAIVLGIGVGNTVYPRIAAVSGSGVALSKQQLLRLGIVLYGLRLTLQDIAHVGLAGIAIDALVLSSTFGLACWIGTRGLGLDRRTAMLIGAGSSICGAAAVMATEPVVKGRPEQVTVAVATVVAFGTLAIFLYPLLAGLNQHLAWIPGGSAGFGVYVGSTVHEVAQVVAAARAIDPAAADTAVIAKMVRVMMLAPFLVLLSAVLARRGAAASDGGRTRIQVPWFAFAFIGVVVLHSLFALPAADVAFANTVDTVLLAMAMAALGLSTQWRAIREAGARPLLLAALLFGWLVGGGALINRVIAQLLG